MPTPIKRLAVLCLLLMIGAGELWAQKPQTREGFWIGFGFGWASLGRSCDASIICDVVDERESVFAGYLMMGGTLSPKIRLGGESYGFVAEGTGGSTITGGNVVAAVYFYPIVTSGLFLEGGLGLAAYTEEIAGQSVDYFGPGFLVGAGYDIRVGSNISITPKAVFGWGGGGDLKFEGTTVAESWKQNYFSAALGITFH